MARKNNLVNIDKIDTEVDFLFFFNVFFSLVLRNF